MNVCSACGQDFGSLSAFDAHRLGKYPQTGPSEYLERLRIGLTAADWTPEQGRRCLEPEEMTGRGWKQDPNGRWRTPGPDGDAFLSLTGRGNRAKDTPEVPQTTPEREKAP